MKLSHRLTQNEIIGNIFVLMLSGYETTLTALACVTYELARHLEILNRLQFETEQLPSSNDDSGDESTKKYLDYDIVIQMPGINLFVCEVLRMSPIANRAIQRCATEDTVVQGIKIEKGNPVLLSYGNALIFYLFLNGSSESVSHTFIFDSRIKDS